MPAKKKSSNSKKVQQKEASRRFGKSYIVLIILIAMALSAAYLLIKGVGVTKKSVTTELEVPQEKQEQLQKHVDNVIEKVKKHIVVNEDEAPYVATISNIDMVKAKSPLFYKNAEQGDKVLIWSDMAVVYSERKDKLVAVTTALPPTYVGSTSTEEELQTEEEAALETATVEIRNGSRIAGEASRLQNALSDVETIEVTRIGDALSIYEGLRFIIQTEKEVGPMVDEILVARGYESVDEAAGQFVSTSTMPIGEIPSDADIVVFIGR